MKKEKFRKLFPHLIDEIERKKQILEISGSNKNKEKIKSHRKWEGYEPDVIDYIRRCKTTEQAEEIINFTESRGEIDHERAEILIQQLRKKGLESFGKRKASDFYHLNR